MADDFSTFENSPRSVWECAMSTGTAARKQSDPLRPLMIAIATASVLIASLLMVTVSLGSPNQSGYGVTLSDKN